MLEALGASAAAFIGTNLDDILILMLLFAQAEDRAGKGRVAAGQYLGLGLLTAASMVCARGLKLIPAGYVRLLGLVPIALGVRAWLSRDQAAADAPAKRMGVLPVAALTIANGGDNLGVYIPLFSGFGGRQLALCAVVFAVFCGLWCLLGAKLASLPRVQAAVRKWKGVLVPAVLILLGLSILLSV